MKKILFVALLSLIASTMFVSCGKNDITLTFEQDEYTLVNNQGIKVIEDYKGVSYKMIGSVNDEISLDANTGIFNFNDNLANYTQVMCIAEYKNVVSNPCLVTLTHDYNVADITFLNLSNYIVDGEFVTARASLPYALTYSLKEQVSGVSINSSTGKVTFTSKVSDGTRFTVVASTHNDASSEKEFIALRDHFVTVEQNRQIVEKGGSTPVTFKLDFSDALNAKEDGLLALTTEQNEFVGEEFYTFDDNSGTLKISSKYLNTLYDGENVLKAITSLNAVSLEVDVATKFIYTPEDLASINSSKEALSGYYILVDDIDMSSYFADNGNGYNGGKGWTPIGLYVDVIDVNQATGNAFSGTFDGNGHTIKGLYSNRKDVNSFNAGLFGYTTTSSIIKNLGVQGELNVSSYSGGFVGTNNGIITNCWADVDITVESGENVYRYVGGFVGNNFGTINNCYALGEVVSDTYFGSFVGSNVGVIESCYALTSTKCDKFSGFGLVDDSCLLFESEEEMQNAQWNLLLPSENWDFTSGALPSLKKLIVEYSLRKISIAPLLKSYYRGDSIPFYINIYPTELSNIYKDNVVFTVDDSGAQFVKNVLYTLNSRSDTLNITASIEVDGTTFSDSMNLTLGKKIESLEMLTVTTMKAGSSYKVGASYLPNDATEKINYKISSSSLDGVTVIDDIVSISEDSRCSSFSIYAMSENGIKSNVVEVVVNPLIRINDNPTLLYENERNDIRVDLPSSMQENLEVKAFGKKIAFEVDNGVLIIDRSLFEQMKDIRIPITIVSGENRYIFDVYSMSHARYDEQYIEQEYSNVIKINSKEDFKNYFNISSYDVSKKGNYDKVFILCSDIDFDGETISGIGYGGSNGFKGKLFGNGHTISNFKMADNESKYTDDSSSRLYGVGLFGSLEGEIYDLELNNVIISSNNFVGGIVGMMMGGKIENCSVNNYSIKASGYTTSHDDVRVGAIIGRQFGGNCLACYADKTMRNLIG